LKDIELLRHRAIKLAKEAKNTNFVYESGTAYYGLPERLSEKKQAMINATLIWEKETFNTNEK